MAVTKKITAFAYLEDDKSGVMTRWEKQDDKIVIDGAIEYSEDYFEALCQDISVKTSSLEKAIGLLSENYQMVNSKGKKLGNYTGLKINQGLSIKIPDTRGNRKTRYLDLRATGNNVEARIFDGDNNLMTGELDTELVTFSLGDFSQIVEITKKFD